MDGEDLLVRVGLTEKQYLAALARMEKQSLRSAKHAEQSWGKANRNFVRGAQNADRAASAFAGGGLKNIGMQLSQVAQQGAVTGNYLQALTVQAADIGLAFGAVGIAVGAAVSVLGPLAIGMIGAGDSAEDAGKKITALSEAVNRLEAASAAASTGRFELSQTYGDLADQAERLFEIDKQIAAIQAQEAFADATRSIAGELGIGGAVGVDPEEIRAAEATIASLRAEIDRMSGATMVSDQAMRANIQRIEELREQVASIRAVSRGFDDLGDVLGVTDEQAREVAARFAEIGKADGAQAQASAMLDLVAYISDVSDNLAEADDEGKQFYDQLRNAAIEALRLAKLDMASGVGAAADEAARLNENMIAALQNSIAIARGIFATGKAMVSVGGSKQLAAYAQYQGTREQGAALQAFISEVEASRPTPSASGRASGGGGGGGLSEQAKAEVDALREVERYVEQTRTAIEEYEAQLAQLQELQPFFEQAGQAEAYARAVQQVTEEFRRAQFADVIDGIESVSDAMANAIVSGEDLGEAMRGVFRQIAADLLSSGIRNLLMSVFGFATGGGGGFLGSLFAGFFDGGGNIPSGKFGIAGENGPEIIRGPAHVTSTKDTARALSSGGGLDVDVRVAVDNEGGLRAYVDKTTRRSIARAAPAIQRSAVDATYKRAREVPIG